MLDGGFLKLETARAPHVRSTNFLPILLDLTYYSQEYSCTLAIRHSLCAAVGTLKLKVKNALAAARNALPRNTATNGRKMDYHPPLSF